MFRIGTVQNDICPSCNEGAETTEHFPCECPAYGRITYRIVDVLQLQQVAAHQMTEILRYINESGVFR